MTMTKEQFERCEKSYERMEVAGGPKSQSEAMLYHQYKQQKQQLEDARQLGKDQFQSDIIEKLLEVQHRKAAETASEREACLGKHDRNTGALGG